ncbi:heat- and acid-stable phosphoprotein [Lunasporangiospora selenospora]|uniref:Heat- and acid-stable phosphoprotein n=1 Tax=Lunasporangiospora selenospora TaxID=979761 RepID=A0A9P6FS51_9FUNG|nr:heat- and acid-stable phosphoprotein [Lunasporangiospora selenospora]
MAGGKFKKPQRGGGRTFSRRIEAVHSNNNTYRDREESENSSAESESGSGSGSGSESESESEEETAAASSKKASGSSSADIHNPNRAGNKVMKASDLTAPIEMSRKEREAAEKEAAKARYWKMHVEGKTDQAKSDMARLAIIRKQREEAAAQRVAEAKGK